MYIEYITISLIAILIFIYAILILLWIFNYKSNLKSIVIQPKVSILIACRNEERNIPILLESLLALDYPKEKLEILIGNDASDDDSLALLNANKSSQIKIYDIKDSINGLKGKMNVLAHLAKQARGEYLYLTDADMTFHPQILQSLIGGFDKQTGIVVGYTRVNEDNLFQQFQNTDYIIGQGMMKIMMDLKLPLFGSGNNMMISRAAYDATGGFENMPFHPTEDVLLLQKVKEKDYEITAVFNPSSEAKTLAMKNVHSLVAQRKRWMQGFSLMPISTLFFSILKLFFLPSICFLIFIQPMIGIVLLALKIGLNMTFTVLVLRKVKLQIYFFSTIFYDLYELLIYFPALISHLFTSNITWKGRDL